MRKRFWKLIGRVAITELNKQGWLEELMREMFMARNKSFIIDDNHFEQN